MASNKKESFTFVHAADLHLDSPFKGTTANNPAIADALRSATFRAYHSLIGLCVERKAAFLLIAGDVYDAEDRSLRAQLGFRDGLVKLAEKNIPVFVAHGNHDPHNSRSSRIEWPKNLHTFNCHKVESKEVEVAGQIVAVISGISHARKNETNNLATKFKRGEGELFQVGLLHCTVGLNTGHDPYAPCEISDLLDAGFDYWALGHVHQKQCLTTDPYVVYSGSTQGRHFRECGERGCYVVTVENGTVTDMEFEPLDRVRWLESSVRIDDLRTLDELDRTVTEAVNSLIREADGRAMIGRIDVGGRGPLYHDLRKGTSVQDLTERVQETFAHEDPFVWIQEVRVDCRPELDIGKRQEADDFLGHMLRIAEEAQESTEKMDAIAKAALSDLEGNRHFQKALGEFSPTEICQMIKEAELICIDRLETEE